MEIVRGEFRESYPVARISRRCEISATASDIETAKNALYIANAAHQARLKKPISASARIFYTCGTPDGSLMN